MSWYCAAEASREFDVDGSVKRDCSRWRSALGVIYLNHAARGAGGAGLGARRRARACPTMRGWPTMKACPTMKYLDFGNLATSLITGIWKTSFASLALRCR